MNKQSTGSVLEEAVYALKQGDKSGARKLLLLALKQSPNDETALYLYSYAARKRETAVQCCQKILDLNPENAQARQRLAKLRPPASAPALLLCPVCSLPFKTGPSLAAHLTNWHASYEAVPAKKGQIVPAAPAVPDESGAVDIPPAPAGFPWGTILFALIIVGGIAGVVLFWSDIAAVLQPVLEAAVFVFFFPLTFPLMMILVGGISTIVAPFLAWMVHLGLFLLTQRWWWFPGGWITGAIAAFFIWSG